MAKKIAILQSNYIPWKGYFDLIQMVDEFVLYDNVQYTKNDWRNRNKIKTPNGTQWLSIPVRGESLTQLIQDTKVVNNNWRKKHWKTLLQNYSKTKNFKSFRDSFEQLYLEHNEEFLSEINLKFIRRINDILGIKTKISWGSDFNCEGNKIERLIAICEQAGADEYISGPAAKSYIDSNIFTSAGIKISWMDYSDYPEYNQLFPPFTHEVSILDLIFNEGPNATNYMKSFT